MWTFQSYLRPGRKLARVRKVLEQKILLQCGNRSSLCDYYQSPLLHHSASPHYPPLYSRNIERKVGDTSIGVGQLSLNSLWPVMLMEVDSRSKRMGAACFVFCPNIIANFMVLVSEKSYAKSII